MASISYFFESGLTASLGTYQLSEETSKHCIQVLRMQKGDELLLTNGKGLLASATLSIAHKKQSIVNIHECKVIDQPPKQITIAIGLLKNANRLEWFLEKVTELGIHSIYLLKTQRTTKEQVRYDRLQQILISAMLQSKQTWLPTLHAPQNLEEVIKGFQSDQKLIAHCEEEPKLSLTEIKIINNCTILIGPEGDFTPEEISMAKNYEYQSVSLGNTRLRTETAGIVAATLLINR